jgi:hypothetical protein
MFLQMKRNNLYRVSGKESSKGHGDGLRLCWRWRVRNFNWGPLAAVVLISCGIMGVVYLVAYIIGVVFGQVMGL